MGPVAVQPYEKFIASILIRKGARERERETDGLSAKLDNLESETHFGGVVKVIANQQQHNVMENLRAKSGEQSFFSRRRRRRRRSNSNVRKPVLQHTNCNPEHAYYFNIVCRSKS